MNLAHWDKVNIYSSLKDTNATKNANVPFAFLLFLLNKILFVIFWYPEAQIAFNAAKHAVDDLMPLIHSRTLVSTGIMGHACRVAIGAVSQHKIDFEGYPFGLFS